MSDYGRTSGTGGVGSAAITNDDKYTQTDMPKQDGEDDKKTINKIMPERAY